MGRLRCSRGGAGTAGAVEPRVICADARRGPGAEGDPEQAGEELVPVEGDGPFHSRTRRTTRAGSIDDPMGKRLRTEVRALACCQHGVGSAVGSRCRT